MVFHHYPILNQHVRYETDFIFSLKGYELIRIWKRDKEARHKNEDHTITFEP